MPSTTLKIAEFAPIPSASVSAVIAVNIGARHNRRRTSRSPMYPNTQDYRTKFAESCSERELLLILRLGRQHHLHQLFGDVRLQPLGVTLAFANHVGDDASAFAVLIFVELG